MLHSAGPLPAPGIVQLRGSFSFGGHHCLVLEQLGPSLLELIATSAHMERREAVAQLRSIAYQLLVRISRFPRARNAQLVPKALGNCGLCLKFRWATYLGRTIGAALFQVASRAYRLEQHESARGQRVATSAAPLPGSCIRPNS